MIMKSPRQNVSGSTNCCFYFQQKIHKACVYMRVQCLHRGIALRKRCASFHMLASPAAASTACGKQRMICGIFRCLGDAAFAHAMKAALRTT